MDIIKNVPLFKGIDDLESMLDCLGGKFKNFLKGDIILMAGSDIFNVGIVTKGLVHIVKDDANGNRTLIEAVGRCETFAEAFCCVGIKSSPVSIFAAEDSEVLFIDYERIIRPCAKFCKFHQKLIKNMLGVVAKKNLYLQNRMEIMAIKSIRGKVLHYLQSFEDKVIKIPFDREGMAYYLSVDRSALSHELMRMKRDGLIDYRKNEFRLINS